MGEIIDLDAARAARKAPQKPSMGELLHNAFVPRVRADKTFLLTERHVFVRAPQGVNDVAQALENGSTIIDKHLDRARAELEREGLQLEVEEEPLD